MSFGVSGCRGLRRDAGVALPLGGRGRAHARGCAAPALAARRVRAAAQDRHHRRGSHRRHARDAVGECRPRGADLLASPGGAQGARRHPWAPGRTSARRARRRSSARWCWCRCPTRRCPRSGGISRASSPARSCSTPAIPTRSATARWPSRCVRKGTGVSLAAVSAGRAPGARLQRHRLPRPGARGAPQLATRWPYRWPGMTPQALAVAAAAGARCGLRPGGRRALEPGPGVRRRHDALHPRAHRRAAARRRSA